MKILYARQSVLKVIRFKFLLAADMKHDRQSGLLRERPKRVECNMARRVSGRTARRNQQRLTTELDRFPRSGKRALEIDERHVTRAEKAPVNRTEAGHHSIVGLSG